jgi:hypothetical protein
MELTEILNIVLGGTSIAGIVAAIVYRKQNRKIKTAEADQANVEAQKAQIELADLYRDKMLEMMDLLNTKQDKGNLNQEKMITMLGNLDTRVDNLEVRMGNVEGLLDGELVSWIAEQNKQKEKEEKMKKIVNEGEEDLE